MKKKYLGLAVTSTLAFSILATSAFAVNDADFLDGLDSTDFALATHAHSTSDVTGLDAELAAKADQTDVDTAIANLEIADANPMLPVNASEPYTCEAADVGAIALTSRFTTCVCTGSNWVLTADGTTECDWNVLPTVTTATGRIWMDRDLGASRVATSSTDTLAYGDLYQWGRGPDGHQLRTSATTTVVSSTDDPGHGDFIIVPLGGARDWQTPRNNTLWQGVSGTNNPCPAGFRVPTKTEMWAELNTMGGYGGNAATAFESPMKMVLGGIRIYSDGVIVNEGTQGVWWNSTLQPDGYEAPFENYITPTNIGETPTWRSYGMSVRCIMD